MIKAYDLDGVFANFDLDYRRVIHEVTGRWLPEIGPNYPDKWSYHDDINPTKQEMQEVWGIIKGSDFWLNLQPYPQAVKALGKLKKARHYGDQIYFVTSRPGRYAKLLTEMWLEDQGYPKATVIIADNKGAIAEGLNLQVFLDDKWENCHDVAEAMSDPKGVCQCQVYLLDKPHNRAFMHPAVTRISSILDPCLYEGAQLADVA